MSRVAVLILYQNYMTWFCFWRINSVEFSLHDMKNCSWSLTCIIFWRMVQLLLHVLIVSESMLRWCKLPCLAKLAAPRLTLTLPVVLRHEFCQNLHLHFSILREFYNVSFAALKVSDLTEWFQNNSHRDFSGVVKLRSKDIDNSEMGRERVPRLWVAHCSAKASALVSLRQVAATFPTASSLTTRISSATGSQRRMSWKRGEAGRRQALSRTCWRCRRPWAARETKPHESDWWAAGICRSSTAKMRRTSLPPVGISQHGAGKRLRSARAWNYLQPFQPCMSCPSMVSKRLFSPDWRSRTHIKHFGLFWRKSPLEMTWYYYVFRLALTNVLPSCLP